MTKVLVGSDARITSPAFVGLDGVTPAGADETPMCSVVRDDGTTVIIGEVSAVEDLDGLYRVTIDATQMTRPDLLTVTWSGVVAGSAQVLVDQVDVAGGFYVRLADLWQLKDLRPEKYSAELLTELRDEFEDVAERWTERAWVPRYASALVEPAASLDGILLPHTHPRTIVSATTVAGEDLDIASWRPEDDGLIRGARIPTTTRVRFTHGADRPPPSLVTACKDYVRAKALERVGGNRIGRDVLSATDNTGGSIRYSTPDWNAGRPTGYLDVDRALVALGAPTPTIA